MAKPVVAPESTEIAWLLFSTLGIVVLTLVGYALYRNSHKILRIAKGVIASHRRNTQKKRIVRLLTTYSDRDLVKIAFSLAAWQRQGFPDKDLYVKRPPHYRWDLKAGLGPREESITDPELSMEHLRHNSRETVLSDLEKRLSHRSGLTLTWLEQRLASDGAPGKGHEGEKN
jgi:hypothetical protein